MREAVKQCGGAVLRFYRDRAIRHGIKCGLAGILAIYIAELMRLPSPGSSLITVFMLMFAQYVGAIADKSLMRFAGTVVGGILGYLFCGSLQQSPVLFVIAVSTIVGFCSAMFGQARYPYGFFLVALTILIICGDGMVDPAASWSIMLSRVQEIAVGVFSSLLVQNLLWPRYARVEFISATQAAFRDLAITFGRAAPAIFEKGAPDIVRANEGFLARTAGLRTLLEHGVRESQLFRRRLQIYSGIVSDLNRIAAATLGIDNALSPGSPYRGFYRESFYRMHHAIAAALSELGNPAATKASREAMAIELKNAFSNLENRMEEIRTTNLQSSIAPQDFMTVGQHILSLDEITESILRVVDYLSRLEDVRGLDSAAIRHESRVSPIPSAFWIRTGIRSAIVTAIALIIVNWIDVPAAGDLLVYSWVFVCITNSAPGGRGDSRAFHEAIYLILAVLGLALVALLLTSALASYGVLNLVIFVWLFVSGVLSANLSGMTRVFLFSSFFLVDLVGLNAQEPVRFVQIEGLFFGLALPLILSALVQRLVLPSLPQWEFRDRLQEFLRLCQELLKRAGTPLPAWQSARLSLIPGELGDRLQHFHPPIVSPEEVERLQEYVATLRVAAFRVVFISGQLPKWIPATSTEAARPIVARLDAEINYHFAAHAEALTKEKPPNLNPQILEDLLVEFDDLIMAVRASMLSSKTSLRKVVRVTGVAGRYHDLAESLRTAKSQADQLRLHLYLGDYWL